MSTYDNPQEAPIEISYPFVNISRIRYELSVRELEERDINPFCKPFVSQEEILLVKEILLQHLALQESYAHELSAVILSELRAAHAVREIKVSAIPTSVEKPTTAEVRISSVREG